VERNVLTFLRESQNWYLPAATSGKLSPRSFRVNHPFRKIARALRLP
jgi:hypothetical protein